MIKELIKLSNHLDSRGLRREADYLDAVIKKIAQPEPPAETLTQAEASINSVRIKNVWNTIIVGTVQYGREPHVFIPNDTGRSIKDNQKQLGIIWRGENLVPSDRIPDHTEIM
jgi:hypothetical protein